MEERNRVEHEKGVRDSVIWQCNEIRLGHAVSRFHECTSFVSAGSKDVVRMHFGLKGDYRFSYRQLDRDFDLIGGHHNIMYSPEFDMVVENKTLVLETFGIQFPRDLFIRYTAQGNDILKRFSEAIAEGRSALLSEQWGAIDPPIQLAIQQIIHCRYTGDMQQLFLLSKSIELLVLCAGSCSEALDKTEPFIKTKADKEKIIAVRDLINEKVDCPPNLSEIARSVGLNEYKLKRGFKETFHTTVFGYLSEQRLHLAHRYLCDTGKTAAEISAELGYATPQHFNHVFKKRFGVTPRAVKNNP
jgi:AraC-like DNA-binding protein